MFHLGVTHMSQTGETSITHPEEMRADFDLQIGKCINLKGQGRLTPAGIAAFGIVTAGILLATAATGSGCSSLKASLPMPSRKARGYASLRLVGPDTTIVERLLTFDR
jgi:hypothetical protein